jgi:hypothetical protein
MSGDDRLVSASLAPSILPGRKEHFQAFAPPVGQRLAVPPVERSLGGQTPSGPRRSHADITQPIVSKPIVGRPIFTETVPWPAVVTYSPLPNLIVHAWRDPNSSVPVWRRDLTPQADGSLAGDRGSQSRAAALDVTQRMPVQSTQSHPADPLGTPPVSKQINDHASSDAGGRIGEPRDRVLTLSLIGLIVFLLVGLAFAVGLAVGEHRDVLNLKKTRSTPAAAADVAARVDTIEW